MFSRSAGRRVRSLRQGIIDGIPYADRSSVMSPPSTRRDDLIITEVLGGSGVEGLAEANDQGGRLPVVAVPLKQDNAWAREIAVDRLQDVKRKAPLAPRVLGPAAERRGDIVAARSQSRDEESGGSQG